MSDPADAPTLPAADALAGHERDARVEQLLLSGLDHYFAGAYEQAIHVWTRVLFLDRGHARARAYIDRARERAGRAPARVGRAAASRHRGIRGRACRRRARLADSRRRAGRPPDVALAYLGRLDRLDDSRPAWPTRPFRRIRARPPPASPSRPERRPAARSRLWLLGAAGIAGVLCCLWAAGVIVDIGGWTRVSRPAGAGGRAEPGAAARSPGE